MGEKKGHRPGPVPLVLKKIQLDAGVRRAGIAGGPCGTATGIHLCTCRADASVAGVVRVGTGNAKTLFPGLTESALDFSDVGDIQVGNRFLA